MLYHHYIIIIIIIIIFIIIIIIIINPLTARVVKMILQPVFSIFPCSPLPSGTCQLQACPFPDVVFPPLPLSALSFFPFHCALQNGFGLTWWTGDMTIPLQFASLHRHITITTSFSPDRWLLILSLLAFASTSELKYHVVLRIPCQDYF